MGQLTNQFVSQSYQGLLNLANANTGFTTNLQTITDGLGGSSALQMSQTQVNISGTFTVNGAPVSVDTGSLVTTSSFNAYTSSVDLRFDGIELETGSLQNQINQKLDTGSFNAYTSSNDSKVNSLIANTGSYATTSSLTALSQSIAATDLAQDNRLTAIESITGSIATTGSLNSYTLTSSFNAYTSSNDSKVNSIISKTGSYATTGSNQFNGNQSISGSVQASSTVTSLDGFVGGYFGSNVNNTLYGNTIVDIKTNTTSNNGKVRLYSNTNLPFRVEVSGSLFVRDGITGSLQGTASYATQALSASWAPDNSNRNGLITTGSVGGNQSITGSLDVQGTISATSASFTYVNTVYETASVIYSSGSNQLGDASDDTQTLWGTVVLPSGSLNITGSIRSTGEIRTDGGVVVGTALLTNQIQNPAGVGDITISTSGLNKVVIIDDVEVTGSLKVTGGITGSLQGTASYATQALSASYAPSNPLPSGVVSGSQQIIDLGFATTGSVNEKLDTGSFNSYTASMDARTGSYATTGSNMFTGQQTINNAAGFIVNDPTYTAYAGIDFFTGGTGTQATFTSTADRTFINGKNDLYINSNVGGATTGSIYITSNKDFQLNAISGVTSVSSSLVRIVSPVIVTGSLDVRNGNLDLYSNNTTVNTDLYLTSSQAGQSNIIRGWNDNPSPAGPASVQANYTGSLRITGSNNTVSMPQIRATALGGAADMQGYISGSDNIMGNNAGIFLNTGSLLFPKTQANILGNGSSILMNFTTSSLAGGHPVVANNLVMGGGINISHPSGSLANVATNAILGGNIASAQNFVTNTRPIIAQNNVIGNVTLNHISSSINYIANYNNAAVIVNNAISSSITNNSLSVSNNAFFGGFAAGHTIFTSGSQSTNNPRQITSNLIGGTSVSVSSSFVSSSNSNLASSLIYGNGLSVFAQHNSGTNGGSAFVGRFNDALVANSQEIVFAVGTGTAAGSRKTGLYVTSGSLVGVSGSMLVNGQTQMTASSGFPLYVSGTIQTQRLHFDGNPFNSNPSSNLGAIRMAGDNQTFQYTNYDLAQITSQSFIDQYVNTGSLTTQTKFGATYGGTTARVDVINNNGARQVNVLTDTMTITGSLGISSLSTSTGSFVVTTDSTGTLTKAAFSDVAAVLFSGGQFAQTGTLTAASGVSGSISYDISGSVNGITLVSGSRLTIPTAGVYNIQFSAQWDCASGADTGWAWFKKNGTNISNSNTKVTMPNNTSQVMTVNILETASVGDYYEVAWQNDGSHARLLGAAATGNLPAIPSVITTITQVR